MTRSVHFTLNHKKWVIKCTVQVTRNQCVPERQSTFAMIKPDGLPEMGAVLRHIHEEGFTVARARMVSKDFWHMVKTVMMMIDLSMQALF